MKKITTILALALSALAVSCLKKENENPENTADTLAENGLEFATGLPVKPHADDDIPTATFTPRGKLPEKYMLDAPPAHKYGQGKIQGSCSSWAIGYGLQSYYRKLKYKMSYTDKNVFCSPAFLHNAVGKNNSDCMDGNDIPDVLEFLLEKGVCTYEEMPYKQNVCGVQPNATQMKSALKNRISSFDAVRPLDVGNIKRALYEGKPVIFSAFLNKRFATRLFTVRDGHKVWTDKTKGSDEDYHAMIFFGWDDSLNAFKALNSWGNAWGENGYVWVDYSLINGKVVDRAFVAENEWDDYSQNQNNQDNNNQGNNNQNNNHHNQGNNNQGNNQNNQPPIVKNPIINVSGKIFFGDVEVGVPEEKTLTVSNRGNADLIVTNITTPDCFFVYESFFTLAPNTSKDITITFSPSESRKYFGQVVVVSNATSGNNKVFVSGQANNIFGITPTPTPSPTPTPNPTPTPSPSYTITPMSEGTFTNNYCSPYKNIAGNIKIDCKVNGNYINFTIRKFSGYFEKRGEAYIKSGSICGNIISQKSYSASQNEIQFSVYESLRVGESKDFYALVISSYHESERYYAKVRITRNH